MNPVNWFEIPVNNMNRAMKFYENSMNFHMKEEKMQDTDMGMFPMESKAMGAGGSLVKAKDYKPSHEGSIVYFSVDNIESTLDRVKANGGKILQPKEPIGEYGFIAFFEDSEGNKIGLHSMK